MFQFVNYRHHSRLGPSFSLANWPSQRHLIGRPWVQQSQLAKYKLSVSDFVANLISGAIAKVFTDFLWRLFCWAGQLFWIVFTEMWLDISRPTKTSPRNSSMNVFPRKSYDLAFCHKKIQAIFLLSFLFTMILLNWHSSTFPIFPLNDLIPHKYIISLYVIFSTN